MKKLIDKIKQWWFNRNKDLSVKEFYKESKRKSKSDLIREISVLAQKLNKNTAGISTIYKKKLRKESKKNLINTLVLLNIENTKEIKKLRKKYAKTKSRRIGKRLYEPVHGVS